MISDTSMIPLVIVPVLSVQIVVTDPKVSEAISFRINPFLFKILCIPTAEITVRAIIRSSGIAETATATAVLNISIKPLPAKTPAATIRTEITKIMIPSELESRVNLF